MYDPSLVEKFSRIYREIAPPNAELESQEPRPDVALDQKRLERLPSRQATLDSISASTVENRMLYELAQVLSSKATVAGAAEVVSAHLRRCVPMSVFVLFVYDQDQDELVARYASRDYAESIAGMRIALGVSVVR